MSSLQKHAQQMVMETTPYKNQLFVTYAVKAAFDRDPTVPPVIVDAVQRAVEDYTQLQTQALRGGDSAPAAEPPGGAGFSVGEAVAAKGEPGDGSWKQRLAEAIEMVVEQEHKMESLGGGGGSDSEVPVARRRRVRFSESEINTLRSGVRMHGEGNWKRMLADKRLKFDESRTPASLKDKWRNLQE